MRRSGAATGCLLHSKTVRRLGALLILTALGVSACVTKRRGLLGPQDGPRVGDVVIQGAEQEDPDEITGGLAIAPPSGLFIREYSTFDPASLDIDRERIEGFYKRRGFFSARVVGVEKLENGPGEVKIRYRVREGRPTRIAGVQVSGLPRDHPKNADRLDGNLREGKTYIQEEYLRAKERVRSSLVRSGYAHAQVDGKVLVDRRDNSARVSLQADPGPEVRFGRTRVEGLEQIPRRAVLARVDWKPGELFDPARLETTRGRLHQLGVFRTVGIRVPKDGRPRVADMTVEVNEGTRHELRLGIGAGADRVNWKILGRVDYSQNQFLLPLMTFRASVKPAYTFLREASGNGGFGGEARAGLLVYDLFFELLRTSLEARYQLVEHEAFTSQGPGLSLAMSRSFLSDRLELGFGYELSWLDFIRVDQAIGGEVYRELGFGRSYRLETFEQSLTWDLRDHVLEPTSGVYLQLAFEEGTRLAGSFGYLKFVPDLRGYLPLIGRRLVAAMRARLGALMAGKDLPITARFYSGGASSQRGFSHRRLSPRARRDQNGESGLALQGGVPVGGEALLETSLELRLAITRLYGQWLGLTFFVDGADVRKSFSQIDPANLHWAAGAGLRYQTPVGPIRLDVGFRLNRTGSGEPDPNDGWAFHISLGEAF